MNDWLINWLIDCSGPTTKLEIQHTGCPNKHGNSLTTFISYSIQAGFFPGLSYCSIWVFQFRRLISKTPGLKIFKMLSMYHYCIFKLNEDIAKFVQRNWVFVTNSNFPIPITLNPDCVSLWHFKLRLIDLTEFIDWKSKV